ncbi:DUF1295 domain-containing protein [Amycolatopsis cihanbeyliensis]|uniref:Steroid 5-alpha reductase family enzyme n=1 Tax=Amycolatopsis cihanbeyliensis TaxID=1128664 RepID=A0A542DHZ8_AMYCI|nr:DUF1295 domain-containing protein [Amycolatopsis cihanbeyliensis]TQJ02666.1 steroid 5-alpha reductase family enzyme [Amycolatopsis cihanbeyliensis]
MVVLALGAAALGTALAVVGVTFLLARRRGRYDLIDSVWGAGFAAIAVVTLAITGAPNLPGVVVSGLTVVWGLRLSVHIHRRNRGKPEDQRYRDILARARGNPAVHMLVRVYLTQAVVMWVVSWPVLLAQYEAGSGFTVLAWLGVAVWIVGFVFEATGDEQLRRFKADPANAGAVLDRGLWRYTRHPNYFGDACVWWGLYLLACHHPLGAVTVFSPILMTWLLARGTGKPLLERQLRESRPRYAEYVERTSGFVPLPPRKR